MPWGDRLDDATLFHLVGKLAWRPVGHGPVALFGQLTGDGDDLGKLFSRELGRRACPLFVFEQRGQQFGEVLVGGSFLLSCRQPLLPCALLLVVRSEQRDPRGSSRQDNVVTSRARVGRR